MRTSMLPLALLALLTACVTPVTRPPATRGASATPTVDALRERIATTIASHSGAMAAVYYQDLARPDSLRINADSSFHAASTMKVPVMIELFRRVDSRTLSLDQPVRIVNSFPSIVDGTGFSLDSAADSDASLYRRTGGTATLAELDELMIAHSSNFATNLVIELLGAKTVNATAHALGAANMRVLRGVEDGKAFAKGLNNTTTARDLGVLLTGIERATVASRRSCAAMKTVLLHQEFSTEIPAGLPPGVPVAHKTGWVTGTRHDAAIVYPPGRPPYVLVVLTRNIPVVTDAQQLIAAISREVYDFNASR
jgi:beta-lactamase class A